MLNALYIGSPSIIKVIRFAKLEDVTVCAFKTGVIQLVRHALRQLQPVVVRRLDALQTSSITAMVIDATEWSFYVGTNFGIVSKFQWVWYYIDFNVLAH